jgi:hypothetical protein
MAAKKITKSKHVVPPYQNLAAWSQMKALPLYSTHKLRKLEPEMKEYLDAKICNMFKTSLPECFTKRNPQEIFCLAMQAMVGLTEEQGNNDGKWIQLIQETYGTAVKEAWCMAAVQTAIAYAELYTGIISLIFPTEHCMTAWRNSHDSIKYKEPRVGFVIIWKHGNTDSGHTGSVEGVEAKSYYSVEGNTGTGTGINRDGDGVYERSRRRGGEGSMKEIGFLDPFPGYAVDLESLMYRVISANFAK